jgi:1A family penicillin-binding protein
VAWLAGIFGVFWLGLLGTIGATALGIAGAYAYFEEGLPPIDNLQSIKFETTQIYDRYGTLLYELYDPNQGKRTYVNIDQIPDNLVLATIATEDKTFEENRGVDPESIARAVYINLTQQGSSGASTITQQLVRRVLLPEGDELSLSRKIREALLALKVTEKYSKDKILEIYLNEIYYGSLSYGVAAAADTYWGKRVSELTLGQASMLAGIPQQPTEYDPNINFELAKARQRIVLGLMVENGFITQEQSNAAYAEDVRPRVRPANVARHAPHFVGYAVGELQRKYGDILASRGGLKVFTTIDLTWQAEAQRIAAEGIEGLRRQRASNAGLVAVNARTGEVLAMVGSIDYTDPNSGEFNVATALRQPGSSIKPITYATAFQRGDFHPGSIVPDLPVRYESDGGYPPYIPRNYDGRFHGPVTIRSALANSFNIPAVEMLKEVGLPAMLDTAKRMGITTFDDPSRYGLALTLGGGEVTLVEMTGAFATFANYGYHAEVTPFLKVVDADGKILEELDPWQPPGNQALDPGVAYQISSILSDNEARAPVFGRNNPLRIEGIEAAAKTGTTNDWKDSWTMGYTPVLAVGVWVGNNDNKPMAQVAGAIGAAPIWNNFIKRVYSDAELKSVLLMPGEVALPETFEQPPSMVRQDICAVSGMAPGPACTHVVTGWFAQINAPHDTCTWHRWVPVTLHNGGATRAGAGVPKSDIIERVYTFAPPKLGIGGGPPGGVTVITQTQPLGPGREPLPTPLTEEPPPIEPPLDGGAAGGLSQPLPQETEPIRGLELTIASPVEGEYVRGMIAVFGAARADNFARYRLEFGPVGGDGSVGTMTMLADSVFPPLVDVLGVWNTEGLTPGQYVLRLTLETTDGQAVRTDRLVRVYTGPPSARIVQPADGSPVYEGEAVTVQVEPDGGGVQVAGVEIYADGRRIASLIEPPWSARWAVITGTHEFGASVVTVRGERAVSPPVKVTFSGIRPSPTPTRMPIMWISRPTLYTEISAGIGEVWVDVEPGSRVHHVDIYIDGYPAGYATGPGYRVNPQWSPTPTPLGTPPALPTLNPEEAARATEVAATIAVERTRLARGRATQTARAQATERAIAAEKTATARSIDATATIHAATASPTPLGATATPSPSPSPTFVVHEKLLDPMLGDFVAQCEFRPGRRRVTAIGYDQFNIEVERSETWVVVR